MMAGIRGKNTRQEIFIRKSLHAKGFRFRLHAPYLPGKPDVVLPKYRAVIFVHGCFWHGHDCHLFKLPGTRTEFWKSKIAGNSERDEKVVRKMEESGWRVMTIWECALRGKESLQPDQVIGIIASWITSRSRSKEIRGKK
jgi:DNA mismatch endonuclease (patch repair protein)